MMLKEFFELRCGSSHNIEQEEIDEKYQIQGWAFGGIMIAPVLAFFLMKIDSFNILSMFFMISVILYIFLLAFKVKTNSRDFERKDIYASFSFMSLLYWGFMVKLEIFEIPKDTLSIWDYLDKIINVQVIFVMIVVFGLMTSIWAWGFKVLDAYIGNYYKFWNSCKIGFLGFYYLVFLLLVPLFLWYISDEDIYKFILGSLIAFFYYFALVVVYLYSTAHVGDNDSFV